MMNKDLSSGLGVVNLETSTMIGGFTGKQGSGGPHDSMAGYIQKNEDRKYSAPIWLGEFGVSGGSNYWKFTNEYI